MNQSVSLVGQTADQLQQIIKVIKVIRVTLLPPIFAQRSKVS